MQFSQNLLTIFNTLKFISYGIKLNYYTINYFLLRIDILYGKSYKNKLIENLKKSMYFVQVKEYRTTFLLNKYLLFFIKKLQHYFSTSTYNIKFQFNFTSKKSLADILDVVDIFIAYKFKFYIDPRLNKIFCIIKNFKNQKLPPIKKSLILYLKPYQIYGIK
ncbi:hypothetical protein E5P55_01180 [Candidatus Pinguicoccus supinus]|uniref:Uncharacterized protein n=1 Tax=Candidatus Pinguicoccus supinus TaxID=2529394 RepID=A0A7T0FXT0_9BACT|nr:hypothetical protein E5P55_01180 [Candidatus Pinguicoccus supinus]